MHVFSDLHKLLYKRSTHSHYPLLLAGEKGWWINIIFFMVLITSISIVYYINTSMMISCTFMTPFINGGMLSASTYYQWYDD